MMQQQQVTQAPGQPIGYAPIYGATHPPLATEAPGATPPPTQSNAQGKRWVDGLIIGGLIGGSIFALSTWGILDGLYSGADIRGLQRQANAANATAEKAEQRAANAEALAQDWEQYASTQDQTIDGVKELICK